MSTLVSKHFLSRTRSIGAGLLLTVCSLVCASPDGQDGQRGGADVIAPHSMTGMDVNLQIENVVSNLSSGFPTQGVAVRHYKTNSSWTENGAGGLNHQNATGTYRYQRTGVNTAVENSVTSSANHVPSSTSYTFESARGGKWVQDYNHGQIVFSGSFSMVASDAPPAQQLAPASNAGLHVALIIKAANSADLPTNAFPNKGLVLQTYSADGSLLFQGFGPGTLNSRGTYVYKKVSANTAVEETIQTSDFFTLPYTMVYTFKTATSGTWFQNFGNGLIRFSGTFDTFPR